MWKDECFVKSTVIAYEFSLVANTVDIGSDGGCVDTVSADLNCLTSAVIDKVMIEG